jgi:hypothetical protein
MHVPEIIEVKDRLEQLKEQGVLSSWELPYENILTRRSAAIFFFTPANDSQAGKINDALKSYDNASFRENTEEKLSKLKYRLTFSAEEKQKNENGKTAAIS